MPKAPETFKPNWIPKQEEGAFTGYTNKNKDFYNSKSWKTIRRQALERDDFLCQHCLKKDILKQAKIVDHIIPINKKAELRLKLSNLQSLCTSCNAIKTQADRQ